VQEPDGTPVANAQVTLWSSGTGNAVVDTNSSGIYLFTGMPNGTYTLWVDTPSSNLLNSPQQTVTVSGDTNLGTTTLPYGYTLKGYILLTDGSPAPNVYVCLAGSSGNEITNWLETDSTGHYAITGIPPGNYNLNVQTADGSRILSYTESVNVNGNLTLSNIILDTVTGHVQEPDGSPVVNAQVILQSGSVGYAYVYTDSNGNYLFIGMPNGTYALGVDTPSSNLLNSPQQSVAVSGDTNLGTTTLPYAYTIKGYVLLTDGSPAPNAYVYLTGSSGNEITNWLETDSTGHYAITGIPAGTYNLNVQTDDGSWILSYTESVNVNGNLTRSSIILDSVTGHVQEPDGSPVANAQVILQSGSVGYAYEYTDSNGNYLFTGMPNGTYTLWVDTPSSNLFDSPQQTVTVSGDTNLGTTTLPYAYIIKGYVLLTDGSPAPNVYVCLAGSSGNEITNWLETDSTGHYAITGIPAGNYNLNVDTDCNGNWILSYTEPINVNGNLTLSSIILDSVTGHVQEPDGTPVANAQVHLQSSNNPCVYTDSNGNYLFTGMPNGTYTLWVDTPSSNLLNSPQQAVGVSGDTNLGTTTLQYAYTVSGYLLLTDGSPAPSTNSYQIYLTDSNGNRIAYSGTDSTGHYTLADLPQGTYNLNVITYYSGGGSALSYSEPVDVNGNLTENIILNSVTGRVQASDGTPVANAQVTCGQTTWVTFFLKLTRLAAIYSQVCQTGNTNYG
jgi:hypothetical protein